MSASTADSQHTHYINVIELCETLTTAVLHIGVTGQLLPHHMLILPGQETGQQLQLRNMGKKINNNNNNSEKNVTSGYKHSYTNRQAKISFKSH